MLKKTFLSILCLAAALILLVYYFGASTGNYSITVNGEEVHGLQRLVFATGGVLVAGLALVGALLLVVLVLAGTSLVLLGIFAFFFLGLLLIFSPALVPVAAVALVVAFIFRKPKGNAPANKRCW
jgi:hypothetical protein